jgi:nucleotide-binding universal stress UspA family protein
VKFEKILVPVDFSAHSAKALDTAIDLARRFEGRIWLLHSYPQYIGAVSPYGVVAPQSFDLECREAAVAETDRWAEKVRVAGIDVEVMVTQSPPSEAIAHSADELSADLIVMGSRGLTGLKHILLGSVTERTLRACACPVLVVKDGDAP